MTREANFLDFRQTKMRVGFSSLKNWFKGLFSRQTEFRLSFSSMTGRVSGERVGEADDFLDRFRLDYRSARLPLDYCEISAKNRGA